MHPEPTSAKKIKDTPSLVESAKNLETRTKRPIISIDFIENLVAVRVEMLNSAKSNRLGQLPPRPTSQRPESRAAYNCPKYYRQVKYTISECHILYLINA
ncbi:predicted protein [Coccidioides posadasii str. Silveira]|uniref:Predicted protein n=2 Tax=Coccidioides posadasii TaxID=199306 RepID=E9D9L9_COCPS|nr:predicted protein [Coccidioides posadasii str. Silveira]KMM70156.1 hypothetical protein CPAG_06467 [Coccidioides posadasii RMSCC 3488]